MIGLDLVRNSSSTSIDKSSEGVGIPTQITASAEVKITLRSRVVYIMELWVANIGDGLDVLLVMDFMFRAGVRVCVQEGVMDEESILMYDDAVKAPEAVDVPVTSPENFNTQSCACTYESRMRSRLGWTRWVTKIVYQARSWSVAIKVVNVSKHSLDTARQDCPIWVISAGMVFFSLWNTRLSRLVDPDPGARPGRARQDQSPTKATGATRTRASVRAEDGLLVTDQHYAENPIRICRSQYGPTTRTPSPKLRMLNRGRLVDASTQTEENVLVTTRMDVVTQVSESQLDKHECDPGEGCTQDDDRGYTPVERLQN
ncbi:LOW QUALITY PROTEIN: hypothetical protein PHMEG_0005398 [Phytophthora megakarya]|uniref:Eukaryotic/viral aspartic protease n=1 Tax=Phytophthora megakarya TaxID=4795 RepID=A0A225WRF1_9STRA|nr:LOW QUALITY PROTEIN: hypothetical protein PHMEG_0005391 [Phytophthora megakarya]OWZ20223.1 LOW QUALITY PROTEIN: hypothetical protein PHMEG_0005398 [Phytophthora megakarya]